MSTTGYTEVPCRHSGWHVGCILSLGSVGDFCGPSCGIEVGVEDHCCYRDDRAFGGSAGCHPGTPVRASVEKQKTKGTGISRSGLQRRQVAVGSCTAVDGD
jgi:hypothetical protein